MLGVSSEGKILVNNLLTRAIIGPLVMYSSSIFDYLGVRFLCYMGSSWTATTLDRQSARTRRRARDFID